MSASAAANAFKRASYHHAQQKGFIFNTTKSIIYDVGSSTQMGARVKGDLGVKAGSTVLVVTDEGIMNNKLEIPALSSLKDEGYDVVVYTDVKPNPPEKNILEALQLAKSEKAKCIIGFGGGSPMDVAKVVAFLAHPECKQNLHDLYGVGMCRGHRLPLIQVPTTAGTGSEATPISIITTGEKEKKGVVSPQLLPDIALLDGRLTLSVPPKVTAATGIDAMVHAIEAYTSRIKKNPLSDVLSRDALRLLGGNIRQVVEDGNDVEARSAMLLGSCFAGMSFANAPVGAVHALAYPVCGLFNTSHGVSITLMLPHVIKFNAEDEVAADMYAEIAPIVFPELASVSDPKSRSFKFADKFYELASDFGLPLKLKDVGIKDKDVDVLVTDAMKQTRLLPNNPREVGPKQAKAIFEQAL